MIVIFTNHAINAFITKQIILSFNNIDKLNFRLMKISIYLFQFRFDIRYRFDKRHVIFDVFFKLSTNRFFLNENESLKLKSYHFNIIDFFVNDQCFVYHDVLINMFSNFHKQLVDDYVKKKM